MTRNPGHDGGFRVGTRVVTTTGDKGQVTGHVQQRRWINGRRQPPGPWITVLFDDGHRAAVHVDTLKHG